MAQAGEITEARKALQEGLNDLVEAFLKARRDRIKDLMKICEIRISLLTLKKGAKSSIAVQRKKLRKLRRKGEGLFVSDLKIPKVAEIEAEKLRQLDDRALKLRITQMKKVVSDYEADFSKLYHRWRVLFSEAYELNQRQLLKKLPDKKIGEKRTGKELAQKLQKYLISSLSPEDQERFKKFKQKKQRQIHWQRRVMAR